MAVVKNMIVRVGADLSRFQTSFTKAAGTMANFGKQSKEAMKSVAAEMKGLKTAVIEDGKSNAGIVSLTDQIRELKEEQTALQAMGFSWGFKRFEENEKQLRSLTEQLEEYKSTLDTPDTNVGLLAHNLRSAVDEADSLGLKLQIAQKSLKELEFHGLGAGDADWDDMYQKVKSLTNQVKEYKASLTDAGSESVGFGQKLKSAVAGMLGFANHSKKSTSSVEGLLRSIRRIGLVSVGLQLVKSIFGELQSVVNQYVSQNAALQAQVTALKSSLGQALAPAINLVTNALSVLMPYVVGVSNAIGSLITNLFGSGWTTVADGANAATSAIGGASSAQKEFNRQLAGFDEITKLNAESSGGGGGGASSSTTPTEAKTPAWLTSLSDQIKQAASEGDFFGIGAALANAVNTGIESINLSDTSLGSKVADFINSGISGATGFVETMDWSGLGEAIKKNVSGLIGGINWKGVFRFAGSAIGGIGSMIWGAIGDSLTAAWDAFEADLEAAGGDVWFGIGIGIGRAIANVGTWIKDNILTPFVEGFKNTFDIHSPSQNKEINSLGENIMLGIFNGITEPLKDPVTWIREHVFTPLYEGFKKIFGENSFPFGLFGEGGVPIGSTSAEVSVTAKLVSWKDKLKEKVVNFTSCLTTWKDSLQNKVVNFKSNLTTWKDSLFSKAVNFKANLTTWKDSLQSKSVNFQSNLTTWKDSLGTKSLTFAANVTKGWSGSLADHLKISSISTKLKLQTPKLLTTWSKSYANGLNYGSYVSIPTFTTKWNAAGAILNGAQIFGRVGNTLLGGGEAGREAVLPLDRNTGWMDKVADRVALRVAGNPNGGDITINLVLDGKVITRTVVRNVNAQARATGKNPLAAYI